MCHNSTNTQLTFSSMRRIHAVTHATQQAQAHGRNRNRELQAQAEVQD
jgi:hypothetical protein